MAAACISPAAKRHFGSLTWRRTSGHDGRRHPKATARSRKQRKGENPSEVFKTGPGQYGEGDLFRGSRSSTEEALQRVRDMALGQVEALLKSSVHEERLLALLILIRKYNGEDEYAKKKIYTLYLKSIRWINNWDLVDLSAPTLSAIS